MSHWVSKPTKNYIDRPAKPFGQADLDDAGDKQSSDRTDDFSPANESKTRMGSVGASSELELPDAEETARAYAARINAGKWGLRKV